MSFWDTLGEIFSSVDKAVNPISGAYNAAQVAATTEDPREGSDSILDNAKQFASAFYKTNAGGIALQAAGKAIGSDVGQTITAPFVWTANQASHGFSTAAAVGGILSDSGQTGLDTLWSPDLWSKDTWSKAWDASEGVSGGEAIIFDQMNQFNGSGQLGKGNRWWANDGANLAKARQNLGFKVSAGAMDILSTWYADPTIVVGKAAKAARVGSRIIDAAQADEVAAVIGKGMQDRSLADRAAGTFATSPEETANRLWHHVAQTDNMDFDQTAAHFKDNLERSGDAGPIVGILGQASKIKDLDIQRKVKADVLLTAAGSNAARDRLITQAPHLARAIQRVTLPPESYAIVDDMVAEGLTGEALTKAAGRWASKENTKELEAYAKDLDDIHTRLAAVSAVGRRGGVENVSGSVLGMAKEKYRAGMAREFFFQPGPHSRTVRVLHWANGQRMKGTIATDDAVRGHDELMDTMTRNGLFTADERKAVSDRWWQAPNQKARSDMAQALPEIMLNKLAAKNGLDRPQLDRIVKSYRGWSSAARTYTTKQMEAARVANLNRVVLEDPMTGVPNSIDRALFESHIENHVAIPEVKTLERLIRTAKGTTTTGDKLKDDYLWALNTAEDANDLWRTLTLARPGFIARTQLDTQARAALTVGATTVVRNAVKGLGHKMTDKLAGPQTQQVEALASDLLRQQNLRREAEGLRRKAANQPGEAGQNLMQRANHLDAEADRVVTYDRTSRRLVTQPRTLDINGTKVTTRAAASDAEVQGLVPALHTGEAGIYDAILGTQSKMAGRFAEDASSWVTTLPDDIAWGESWLRSKDAMMRSKAGRAILDTLDEPSVDMVRHLKANPEVQAAWREVRDENPEFDSWLDRAIAQVEWTAPTPEVRQALRSGRVLNLDDVDQLFKPAGAVSEREALDAAHTFATKSGPLTERIDRQRERVAAAQNRVDRARRPDTAQRHQEKLDRHQERLDKLQGRLDDISSPATVAPEHVDLADRMPVHAPKMDVLDPQKHGVQSAMDMAKRFVRWMSDTPDTVLGRVPFYTERYFAHYKELAARELDRSGELGIAARARIEEVARHRAIQDTRQTMYDTARFTGAHDRVARLGFAFLGAWEDSMRAWGKIMYDDPSRWGKLMKTWYAPERGGFVVDENGNRVNPGDTPREKWLVLPVHTTIPDWVPAVGGARVEEFKVRKDSFNSMFQGQVPWAPGFGPGVQIPVTQIAAKAFPEAADPNFEIGGVKVGNNPIMRQLFGFGLPKTGATAMDQGGSIIEQAMPGWLRRLKDVVDGNSQQFSDAYLMAFNAEIVAARDRGQNVNSSSVIAAADKKAKATARSMMFLEFASNWGLGLSGEGATKADFYRQQYRQISKNADKLYARGSSPAEEMVRQFPETAGLNWSLSENKTGINASLKVEDRVRKYGKDIQKNPEFGWFYVGSDNIGGEFSAASYAAEFGREATPGSGDTWRGHQTVAQIRQKGAASLGWDEYYKIKDEVDAELVNRGLHSLQQKGAEDLEQIMKDFRAGLSQENPEWAKDYNSFDSSKVQTFLTQVAGPAMKDGRLKNRSDIKMMAQYLQLRDEASKMAEANGSSLGARDSSNIRAILLQAGNEMAQENIGFSQIWQRVLQREIDLPEDAFPDDKNQTGNSALNF